MPRLAKGDAASESKLLEALAHQEKLLLHVSDQVSSLARMRMPVPASATTRERPKEIFGRLTAEVFVVIIAVTLTFILRIALSRTFPDFYETSAVSTVCDLVVAILVIRFAFVCWEPLRNVASWTYSTIRNFITTRGARSIPDDLSITGH